MKISKESTKYNFSDHIFGPLDKQPGILKDSKKYKFFGNNVHFVGRSRSFITYMINLLYAVGFLLMNHCSKNQSCFDYYFVISYPL